ncbi:MAG: hypothetical protein U9Q66_03460, partial [Patescibacteria group bacterium]|nr:hypothetical protein [Patescibacteria group bacterium]
LDEMARFIDRITSDRIIKFSNYDRSAIYIKDEELQFIDQLIDHGFSWSISSPNLRPSTIYCSPGSPSTASQK